MALASQADSTPKAKLRPLTLAGVVLALAAPLITWILDGYFRQWFDYNGKVLAGLVSFWAIVAVVLLLMRFEEGRAAGLSLWQDIGFKRPKLRESLIVLIIGFVTLGLVNVAFVVLSRTIFPTEIKVSPA